MARIVRYRAVGGPEVLETITVEDPEPGPGEVRVAVQTIGVNPVDWKLRAGFYGPVPDGGFRVPGADAAGTIEAVGEGVEDFEPGDEVIVTGANGAYTTSLIARADQLDRKPSGLSWQQAAALGVPVGTAYQAIRSLQVAGGNTLLVHGGAGGVGQAAIQFAVREGATVVATARVANHRRIRALGAVPVEYGPGLIARIASVAPEGISVALDAVGTDEALDTSFHFVSDRSRIGTVVRGADAATFGIRAWSGGSAAPLSAQETRWRREAVPLAARLTADGEFDIEVSGIYPLEQAAEAHRESERGHVRGKIVLVTGRI